MHNFMNDFEKKKIEMELRSFTFTNFERPAECRSLEQIRLYIKLLCNKIEDCESQFNYVPESAYSLLAQYNARQNSILYHDFVNSY